MVKRSLKSCFSLLFGAVFAFCSTPGAFAQDNTDEFMLEEITVTAQKREENQQKVAIAMDVVSAEDMTQQGMHNIDDVLKNVSNVIINKSADGMRISLRGLADDGNLNMSGQHTSTPTVAVNVDGAYNNTSSAGQGLFDVERVEVMYGPQSTMYASNSPGGIVNVITASPKLDRYEASGLVEYGSYDLLHTEGAMNVPINDSIALRAAFSTQSRDGYISNGGDSEDTKSARLKALYQMNENMSLTLTGNYSINSSGNMASVEAFDRQGDVDDPWTSSDTMEGGSDERTKAISAEFSWDNAFGSLTMVPSYNERTSSGTQTQTDRMSGALETSHNDMSNTQKGAEARMTNNPDFLFDWILGVNYYESEDVRDTTYEDSDRSTQSLNNQKSYAIFGNITYPITDSFRGTLGYRHSWDEVQNYSEELNKPDPGGTMDMISDTFSKYNSPDIKIGIEYDLGADHMLYANYSTSYRMQGMGMPNADGETAPPEELQAYTIGAKQRFLNNRLQVNSSAFWYEYKNKTASQMKGDAFHECGILNGTGIDLDINGDGVIDRDPDNTYILRDSNSQTWGDFRNYGVDVQATYVITAKDKLNVNVSWLKSEWTDLVFNYEFPDFYEPEDFTGMVNTFAPEWTVNVAYDRKFNLSNGAALTGRIDGQYQSEYILSWSEKDAPYNYQEGYYMLNASMMYGSPDGKWNFNVYGKNLTNYAKKTSYSMESLRIDAPRTFGAVLSMKF